MSEFMTGTKLCQGCDTEKPLSDFYKGKSRPSHFRLCKVCFNLSQTSNKSRYYQENLDYFSEKRKQYSVKTKLDVVNAYGRYCSCCGEGRIEFLCIDHINGGGAEERRVIGRGHSFYRHLIKSEFPSGYRVLCHNCNFSLGKFGYCPHES